MSLSEIFWLPGGPWPSEKMEGYMQRTAKAPVGSRAERWVAAMMLITAVASVGCAELLDVLDPPGEGFLDVFMQIDGDPARPVEGLRVKAVSIEAVLLRDGATEEEIITIREDPPELVVSSHSFGVPLLVARASLPVGEVRQIRVVLESAHLRESGETLPLDMEVFVPSGQQTGLKAIPRHGVLVRVTEGQATRALVNVDLASQLIEPPGRGLLLEPTSDLSLLDRATVADFVGENEIVLSTARTGIAETGIVLEIAKVLDTETGVVRTMAVDGAGALRDLEEVAASERAAYRAAHGVLLPGLVTDLEGVSADRLLSLEALVAVPPTGPYEPLKLGSLQERDAHSAAYREQVKSGNAPFVDAAVVRLEGVGALVTGRSNGLPMVTFSAPRALLEDTIAFLPELSAIDLVGTPRLIGYQSAQDLVDHALFPSYRSLPQADTESVRVVIHENECADASHPTFSQANVEPSIGTSISDHATRVMSIAGSVCPLAGWPTCNFGGVDQFAGAYRASLRSVCAPNVDPLEAVRTDVLNQSFVANARPSVRTAGLDQQLFLNRVLLVRGSDNRDVPAKCFEYNGICVGGYDPHDTYGVDLTTGVTQFDDDTPRDAYRNVPLDRAVPPMSLLAREEPDVVAKSRLVIGAVIGGGYSADSGTSYASPAVAGLAALLMSVFPDLRGEPSAMRALLMASAHHNIADVAVPSFSDEIDDRDGAGAPRGDRALVMVLARILTGERLHFGILDRDQDFDAGGDKRVTFHASAGQVVRVVLAWDACPYDAVFGPFGLPGLEDDFLTIDLDLLVEGPPEDGRTSPFLKANPSWVDNYEIVELFVPRSGMWTIRVQAPRWNGCAALDIGGTGARRTYFGLAWDIRELFE